MEFVIQGQGDPVPQMQTPPIPTLGRHSLAVPTEPRGRPASHSVGFGARNSTGQERPCSGLTACGFALSRVSSCLLTDSRAQ